MKNIFKRKYLYIKETTVKAIGTFANDKLDQILTAYKFTDELGAFINEYLHEHPDEFENVYTVFKSSNPSFSVIIEGEKYLVYKMKKRFSMIKNKFLKLS